MDTPRARRWPGDKPRWVALRRAGRYAFILVACALAFAVQWLADTFGDVSLGQILFHWRYLGGSDSIAKGTANDFLMQCLVWPAAVAALLLWADYRMVRPLLERIDSARMPRIRRWLTVAWIGLPALAIGASLSTLGWRTSAWQFIRPPSQNDFFASRYVPPNPATLTADKPKNLVLIYVESLETAYRRTDVFGRDLLAPLSELHPMTFRSYEQLPGTGYTIAALVSTQCAVPLQIVGVLDWQRQGETAQQFLPGATCLGDLLASQGYRNVFMGGASLLFSGKGKFFTEHHFQEAFGREEWIGKGYSTHGMSGWGLHDDDLFDQAKAEIRTLHKAGQPFNLTVLTVDSHFPAGHLSESCRRRGAKALDEIVECTAAMVADLVKFVRTEGYDSDTNIVVLGDHLSPPNTLADPLSRVGTRTIYNGFFARTMPTPNRTALVHFDMLATILEFIGLHAEGGRAGLGFSAFGPPPTPFPTALSRAELGEHTLSPSRAYLRLWEPVAPKPASGPASKAPPP